MLGNEFFNFVQVDKKSIIATTDVLDMASMLATIFIAPDTNDVSVVVSGQKADLPGLPE